MYTELPPTHMAYMIEADAEAALNLTENEGGPFGAVIVKDGAIIGRGRNRVIARHDPTCHAEIEAIRDACQSLGTHDLSGCVLYTSCYPCPMCLSATIWANIKTVYYGNTAQDAAAIGFRDDFIYRFIEEHQKKRRRPPSRTNRPRDDDPDLLRLSGKRGQDTLLNAAFGDPSIVLIVKHAKKTAGFIHRYPDE